MLNHGLAVQAADRLAQVPGVRVLNDTFFNEFTILLDKDARSVARQLADRHILCGVALGRLYPDHAELANGLLVTVTETTTEQDIGALCDALREVLA
jgi:glycine dehydrogenase subunit 1